MTESSPTSEPETSRLPTASLSPRAKNVLKQHLAQDEKLIWAGQPARLNKTPIVIMMISLLLAFALQIPVILDDPESLPIVLIGAALITSIVGVTLFFMVKGQFRNTWYFLTSDRALIYLPILVKWGRMHSYPIGPNSEVSVTPRGETGHVVIKSPDYYETPDLPGGYIRFSNVQSPDHVQYQVAWVIAAKRQSDGTTSL